MPIDDMRLNTPVEAKADFDKNSEYVFASNGRHDNKEFLQGQPVKASSHQMEKWLVNGVIIKKEDLTAKIVGGRVKKAAPPAIKIKPEDKQAEEKKDEKK